ncbi:hypothetical protein WJX82_004150 [Trebouxia sp. C0006]
MLILPFRLIVLAGLVAQGCPRVTSSWPPASAGKESLQTDNEGRSLTQAHSRALKQGDSASYASGVVQGAAAVGGPNITDPSIHGNSMQPWNYQGYAPPFVLTGNEYFYVSNGSLKFVDLEPADNLVNIYTIYYGNWGVDRDLNPLADAAQAYCLNGVPSDPNQTSGGCAGKPFHDVGNQYHFAADATSVGTTLDDATTKTLIMNKINSQDIAYDPFGLYLIIVSPEIQYTGVAEARDAFCTKSCGMHDFLTARYHSAMNLSAAELSSTNIVRAPGAPGSDSALAIVTAQTDFAIPYAIVGNPGTDCRGCQGANAEVIYGGFGNNLYLPNFNAQADAVVTTVAHELAEAFTDPQFVVDGNLINGFTDGNSQENADKCTNRWTATQFQLLDNGQHYTHMISGLPYIIQDNWLPVLKSPGIPGQVGCVPRVPAGYAGKTYLSDPVTGVQPTPPAQEPTS